jgi:hypothetical protein
MKKHLRDEWNKAGYGSQMGSAEVVPPPPSEVLRLYHLTSAEFGISDIALGRVKVARFSDSNDPFELLSMNCKSKDVRDAANRYKDEYSRANGIVCFSANWTNPVLWAHYANKHSGLALGFDLPVGQTLAVDYQEKRSAFALSGPVSDLPDKVRDQLLRTKFKHWEYEAERRLIVPLEAAQKEGNLYFLPFAGHLTLREVVLGPACNLALRSVRALVDAVYGVSDHPVRVFCSRIAFGGFTVVPKESTVDW